MFNKTKIAIAIAIAIGIASGAFAATKHPVHQHRAAAKRQLPGVGAFGYANFGNTYPPSVVDALKREAAGDPRCWGGNCDPVSGSGLSAN